MKPRLQLEDVTVSFNRVPAIHHVSMDLCGGVCVGLFGPNGAGKTTLLKCVAGLLKPETGRVLFRTTDDGTGHEAARRLAYVPQREAVDWDFPITVRALVEMGRFPHVGWWRAFSRADRDAVDQALKLMDLEDFANRQIKALSGGQQQRAFLARAWAQQSELYLLDEPFTGLDARAKDAFAKVLHGLRDEGKIVIASHHSLSDATELFDSAILINGEVVATGAAGEVMTPANIDKAFSTRIFVGGRAA